MTSFPFLSPAPLQKAKPQSTKSGNGHFLAYIPSWGYNQPSLVREGDARHAPFHNIYHHRQSCIIHSIAESANTLPLFLMYPYMYSACGKIMSMYLGLKVLSSEIDPAEIRFISSHRKGGGRIFLKTFEPLSLIKPIEWAYSAKSILLDSTFNNVSDLKIRIHTVPLNFALLLDPDLGM